ncbi:hypothetical protein COW36_18830 [bacterium (Candidatus Blackallbacteria) CG17_big_fil_post_rev_8_21_14_2_50_48_46]|uniref:Uncharacterized protein n=1 Tax=bacterium (Candidatus Blackallbacteria) CG17_big_fil_post_rev_8_21_14_2_50_48_46 TaxID=2014261 RepID=A0A2M7FZY4_9BACT|nr:MAG: hypothetical protein COW64_25640 [bacterium (Candidatus Blackallbacteria) CG18_big_fil_WC_8_21_14_2_50_49_26]PIW14982.1 MAG: hypothetical protein COW36_18830 [bacterium (Candidatus Blackallbacteria) CG17_big_fil_post_rev_8_21_14_2_50_48_46]PIW50063.1 MAG: hypothetical protein COW20_03765 [bacterium (Candidatus Blackallbacteria) CG13_big_fil_rev_8_21_14_2_50_49_14]
MPNVNRNVFNAIQKAVQSESAISSSEFKQIQVAMAKDGIDSHEAATLDALQQGNSVEIHSSSQSLKLNPNSVQYPLFESETENFSLTKAELVKLAESSNQEIQSWYDQHPENRAQIREAFNQAFETATPEEQNKLEKLGTQLQRLQDRKNISSAERHYSQLSPEQISQEMLEKIAGPRDARQRPMALSKLAEDLRLLSFASKSSGGRQLEEKVYSALAKALEHRDPNGTRSIPAVELAEALSELKGPGSAQVKARMIKMAQDTENLSVAFKASEKKWVKGGISEMLLKSDPIGIANELEFQADRNRGKDSLLLNRSLDSIVEKNPENPDQAADTLGEILGNATREYADAILESPPDQKKIDKLSHQMGYLLRATEKTIEKLAKSEKAKVDQGAFIAKVFSKGVSKLSGVKGIETLLNKGIDTQAKREKNQVENWQKGIVSSYQVLMNQIFMAHEPGGGSATEDVEEFQQRQNNFETAFQKGYDNHLREETPLVPRTHR